MDRRLGSARRNGSEGVAFPPARSLFIASALALFAELLLIRWTPATIHVVGFFTNLALIGAFLGLGIGFSKPSEPGTAAWVALFRLASGVAVFGLLSGIRLAPEISKTNDYDLNEVASRLALEVPLPILLTGIFAIIVWMMIPFGRLVAGFFDELPPLRAYTINIGGSLAGIVAFTLVAWVGLPPVVWFAAVCALVAVFVQSRRMAIPVLLIATTLGGLWVADTARFTKRVAWSPYYKVIATPVSGDRLENGLVMDVNGQFLLTGLDLRPNAALPSTTPARIADAVEQLKSYYNLPFTLRPARRVLILGAGAGNDVAAALRNGAERVTAVEIDPLVLRYGRRYHPERPYSSSRVTLVLNDARAFLRRNTEKFDLVLFATLDAHGLLSAASNVRLDSFIYTEESLRSAKELLSPDGLLVLSFGPFREDVQFRQYAGIRGVFGQVPLYLRHSNNHRTIVAGDLNGIVLSSFPPQWSVISPAEIQAGFRQYPHAVKPATDDWPYLYLRSRRIPKEYGGVLIGMMIIALALVRRAFAGAHKLNGHFLFLGAGFLLLETKSVTEFALLAGSTWQTNAFVIGIILATILAANVLVRSVPTHPPIGLLYVLLIAGLVAGYTWPVGRWAGVPGPAAYAAAAAYLGVPIFLAAVIFATTLRDSTLGSAALASNLLGAVLGGISEYLSLVTGIRALALLAVGMYVASYLFLRTRGHLTAPANAQA